MHKRAEGEEVALAVLAALALFDMIAVLAVDEICRLILHCTAAATLQPASGSEVCYSLEFWESAHLRKQNWLARNTQPLKKHNF